MKYYSDKINKLVAQLMMLPGIGEKSAERLAYCIVKLPKDRTDALVDAIQDACKNVKYCKICCSTSDEDICPVCASKNRDHKKIMVVENDDDMGRWSGAASLTAFTTSYRVLSVRKKGSDRKKSA